MRNEAANAPDRAAVAIGIVFVAALLGCVIAHVSILIALVIGLVLFWLHGHVRGFTWRQLGRMSVDGIKAVRTILFVFVLIGVLTAFWRAAGTIPFIVGYASLVIDPAVFVLATFLLNCLLSILTGTSFGTAATMGVICVTLAQSFGVDLALVGGAVLAGAFFGDRCSPVSTSALLVAQVTDTDIYANIRQMLRTALVPFVVTCVLYAVVGLLGTGAVGGVDATGVVGAADDSQVPDLLALFATEFDLHWTALLPAIAIIVLAVCRIDVKISMGVSIVAAAVVAVAIQGVAPDGLAKAAVLGFMATNAHVGAMLDGGGIVSMLTPLGIVCLSSAYAGIFQKTGFLDGAKHVIARIASRATPFAAVLVGAVATNLIACNQTLAIMLTRQVCDDVAEAGGSNGELAIDIEDSAVVVAALVPWSIAATVPLTTIGAPIASIVFAFYLYLQPVWRLLGSFVRRKPWNPASR